MSTCPPVRRGWLGVRIQNVTDELAEGLRRDAPHGALVASVSKGGPAEAAGIKQGDVILTFDGRTVNKYRNLSRMVAEFFPLGTVVSLYTLWVLLQESATDYFNLEREVVHRRSAVPEM